jgi:hypothetical protein
MTKARRAVQIQHVLTTMLVYLVMHLGRSSPSPRLEKLVYLVMHLGRSSPSTRLENDFFGEEERKPMGALPYCLA